MLLLEPPLSEPVLLGMVVSAKADAPAIGRFESDAAVGTAADMGALDRQVLAAGHAAMMFAHPGAVCRAGA